MGYFQKRYWNREYFTSNLPPSICVKDHNLVKSKFEDGSRDEQGLLGSSLMIPFAKGKVTGLNNLKLQGFALPSNVEAIYHHKSMGPVPCKWLLRVIKRSAVQSMDIRRLTFNKLHIAPSKKFYHSFLIEKWVIDFFYFFENLNHCIG